MNTKPQAMPGMSKKVWAFTILAGLGGWAMAGAIVYWGVKGFS